MNYPFYMFRLSGVGLTLLFLIAAVLTTGAPGAYAQKRGKVTSARCPYNCKTIGLEGRLCRQWREGDLCYVEDLTRAPDPAPKPKDAKIPDARVPDAGAKVSRPAADKNSFSMNVPEKQSAVLKCRKVNPYYLSKPIVRIKSIRSVDRYAPKEFKVGGTIEGICIVEAGYYEDGERVFELPVSVSRQYRSYSFAFDFHAEKSPQIRVIGVNGVRTIKVLDPSEKPEPSFRPAPKNTGKKKK